MNILSAKDAIKAINGEKSIIDMAGKNTFEYDSIDELTDKYSEMMRSHFISQLKIINVFNKNEYDELCGIDFSTRNGLNYKTATQIGEYRFNEMCYVDRNNLLKRRYFILNFNKVITIEGSEYTTEIFEVDMNSFCILICEICSAKQDIEDNIDVEDAKKYLTHMENIVTEFINKYFQLLELDKQLKK